MEYNIRIAGEAGQGVQSAAVILGKAALRSGFHVYGYMDVESRIRGGLNFAHMRISSTDEEGVRSDYGILMALSSEAVDAFCENLWEDGVLISSHGRDHVNRMPVNIEEIARNAGAKAAVSTVGVSCVCALIGIDQDVVSKLLNEKFSDRRKILEINLTAMRAAYEAAGQTKREKHRSLPLWDTARKDRLFLTGHEAVALGAVAGGVSFVTGYPMSPATGILNDIAKWSRNTGIVMEQAEDEIAAVNMLAGASYAGARVMTATSGGGFCLMTEGVSLIGMIEVPAVIVIAQRPGPATGLPTKTAQGDLHLVLHAGHGFFPRVILAPQNIHDCFEITARAFDIAEKYQVPVFVLTDQLLQDSFASLTEPRTDQLPGERHLLDARTLDAMKTYRRYENTDSGISPMAIPGLSRHVVVVDSDEHDENGHLIEDAITAGKMTRKRLRKADTVSRAHILTAPVIEGDEDSEHLFISWGSSYETVKETLNRLRQRGACCAHLNLRQLWPLDAEVLGRIWDCYEGVTIIENNVTGELCTLLETELKRTPDNLIKQVDGRPFSVQNLTDAVSDIVNVRSVGGGEKK